MSSRECFKILALIFTIGCALVVFLLCGFTWFLPKTTYEPAPSPKAIEKLEKSTPKTVEKCEESAPNPMEKCDNIPLSEELQNFTQVEAERNGVPYPLVLAVMEQESRFDLEADSGDSFGVMQINECHGPRDIIIQPRENIQIGCWLLGYLYREYGNWHKALVAYNCGEAGAEQMYFRHGHISSSYSRQVMRRSEKWAKILGENNVDKY